MIDLNNLKDHLKNISSEDWDKFFEFIPIIEKGNSVNVLETGENGEDEILINFYYVNEKVSKDFFKLLGDMKILLLFNKNDWEEENKILDNLTSRISSLDEITICKLFVLIVEESKLSKGYVLRHFENGNILLLLRRLKEIFGK